MSARRARGVRRLLAALSLAFLAGCATLRLIVYHPARLASCPGIIAPTERIEGDFIWHMQIHLSSEDVDTGYGLVVQKKGEHLVLIGLTRFGAKAFSVVQEGLKLEVESALGPATVVPPENILRDLHRARFLAAGAPLASGSVEARHDGETIRDTWRDGVLERRVFSAADGDVELEFLAPGRVHIHNRRCGYEAILVDVEAAGDSTDERRRS